MSDQNIESYDQQLENATVDMSPSARRERNIDEMYKDFMTNAEQDTYITQSEFQKYEILYSSETRKRLASTEATREERDKIAELSQEFYYRVNTQKPIHVVDDYTGKDIFVLPPIYRRLNMLSTAAQAEATQILASTFEESDASNPTAYVRKQVAVDNLYRNILAVQDNEQLKRDQEQYIKLSQALHKNYLHDEGQENAQEQKTVQKKEAAAQEIDDEDILDFDE